MPTRYRVEDLGPLPTAALAAPWREAEAACPDASPFVRWPWVSAWHEVFGAPLRPRLFVFRRRLDGSLAGAALVGARQLWRRKVFPVRQLLLNTTGEPDRDSPLVEFNHLLVPAAERAACTTALLLALAREPGWDELVLSGLPQEDLPELSPALPLRYGPQRPRPCFAMDLDALRAAGKTPEAALSSNTRAQINRSLRLYGGRDALTLDEARDPDECLRFLDELAALHHKSWEARGEAGVFESPDFRRFHERLIRGAPEGSGLCQLLRLRTPGETIGLAYNIVHGGTVYFYQSGLKLPADAKEKPGLCLHLLAMNLHMKRGQRRYDFMASDARYKRSLSNSERTLVWGVLQRPSLTLALEDAAVRTVHYLRSLRPAPTEAAAPTAPSDASADAPSPAERPT